MNAYLSNKLRNLSFLLMILVAFIHGYNVNLKFSDGEYFRPALWLQFLEGFVSDGICRVAVPMFFAISGYLATQSLKGKFNVEVYWRILRKRFSSLLIPYLSVSAIGIATVFILQLIPFSRPFFNNFNLKTTTLGKWIWIWLVSPVPYQLWFLRFLCIYFLQFPIIYYLAKYLKLIYILALVYYWSNFGLQQQIGDTKIEAEGLLFFSVGVFAATSKMNLLYRIPSKTFYILLTLWIIWVAYRTLINIVPELFDHYAVHYHLIGFTFLGFVLFWFLYDQMEVYISQSRWINEYANYSFGIFLFHEPFLTIIKKILIRIGASNDVTLLLTFILAPVLGFGFGLLVSRLMFRFIPSLYSFLTGNRKPVVSS
jgi:peptidoglycan/LPS O-acetylase OafA/YrhL